MDRPCYTIKEAQQLRDSTEEGAFIRFTRRKGPELNTPTHDIHDDDNVEVINGFIEHKYEHTFSMNDGRVFKWTDYLIGKEY